MSDTKFDHTIVALHTVLFVTELQEFRKIIDEFIEIAETIVNEVEQEKTRAIAAQNLLKSMAKLREAEQQEIQVKFKRLIFISEHKHFTLIITFLE